MTPIDHVQLGLSRVARQFQESPRFLAFLTALLTQNNDIEACLQAMMYLLDIDVMTGVNLDVIGRIVGVSRHVDSVVLLDYFGFADTGSYATRFGEETDGSLGARFYEEGEDYRSTTILADPEYRMLLRAKIVKNSSFSTNEDIIMAMQYLFNTLDVKVEDNMDMTITLAIGRPLLASERAMIETLDILPRPGGVRVTGISSFVPIDPDFTGGDPPYGG